MMSKVKVFISRELGPESEFRNAVDASTIEIINQYLIDFQPITFETPSSAWIFFYSKSGIKYYLQNRSEHSKFKIAAFGPSTAKYFRSLTDHLPEFIGSAEKNDVALAFSQEADYESCTFVVGERSLRSVQKILNNRTHNEIVVYRNAPKKIIDVECPDVAVFTSPLSANIYFSNYKDREHPNIAIGNTTAEAIEKNGKKVTAIPSSPNENELAKVLNSYLRAQLG